MPVGRANIGRPDATRPPPLPNAWAGAADFGSERAAAPRGIDRRARAPKDQAMGTDESTIAEILDAYAGALRRKDARATVAFYARDAVAYELAPPLQVDPAAVHDPRWIQQWFDTWDGPISTEARDLRIAVGGDVAHAWGLRRMTGVKTSGERVDLWFRSTACFRREDGAWKLTHVHNSVPFAMDGSDRAMLDLKP